MSTTPSREKRNGVAELPSKTAREVTACRNAGLTGLGWSETQVAADYGFEPVAASGPHTQARTVVKEIASEPNRGSSAALTPDRHPFLVSKPLNPYEHFIKPLRGL